MRKKKEGMITMGTHDDDMRSTRWVRWNQKHEQYSTRNPLTNGCVHVLSSWARHTLACLCTSSSMSMSSSSSSLSSSCPTLPLLILSSSTSILNMVLLGIRFCKTLLLLLRLRASGFLESTKYFGFLISIIAHTSSAGLLEVQQNASEVR